MAVENPLDQMDAAKVRRGSQRLLRALFPERFAAQPADSLFASGPEVEEALELSLAGRPSAHS